MQLSKLSTDITPFDFRNQLQKLIHTFPEHQLFFSDGSQTDSTTSSIFVTNDCTHKIKLHHLSGIYSVEANAIAMGLDYSSILNVRNIVIASDSLSTLKALSNMYYDHPGIQRIQEIGKIYKG